MIEKKALIPQRVRKICGSFAFIEHRFLREGFWANLTQHELLLYIFLVLVADRQGLSYYSFDKICSLQGISTDEYIAVRNGLINKDMIAFDGFMFQVLSLPDKPVVQPVKALTSKDDMARADPATIQQIIRDTFRND